VSITDTVRHGTTTETVRHVATRIGPQEAGNHRFPWGADFGGGKVNGWLQEKKVFFSLFGGGGLGLSQGELPGESF